MIRSLIALTLAAYCLPATALELRVAAQPLQRALVRQLFSAPDGRYYLHGTRTSGCYLFAQRPQLSFSGKRVVLQMNLEGKVGREFAGQCFGVHWAGDGRLSMLPQSQGTSIGFTDVRVEQLTNNDAMDKLLGRLIATLAPRSFHVDAAPLVRNMLHHAGTRSGTDMQLDQFVIRDLQVENEMLDAQVDGVITIQ